MDKTDLTLIKPSDVAQLLGVTEGTLQKWRSTGAVNLNYVKVGGAVMYRLSDIRLFIEQRVRGG